MKTYTENQIQTLRPIMFTAVVNGTYTYVKAYLKENAFKYFKNQDNSLTLDDVSKSGLINSHGSPIDKITQTDFEYENGVPVAIYSILND